MTAWLVAAMLLVTVLPFGSFAVTLPRADRPAQAAAAQDLTEQERGWLARAGREDVAGWIYLRVEGAPFDASEFLRIHPQWNRQEGYLQSRPYQPWVLFDGAAALPPAWPR